METLGMHTQSIDEFIQAQTDAEMKEERLDQILRNKTKNQQAQLDLKNSKLRRFAKYLHPSLLAKSPVCRHQHGCLENCFRRSLKVFLTAFSLTLMITSIRKISQPLKFIKALLQAGPQLNAARLALFLTLLTTSYKFVLCLLRRLGCHNDRINAPVAGFLSAFSIVVDKKSRKQLFMVLVLSRAVDSGLILLEDNGLVPKTKQKYLIMWILCNWYLQTRMSYMPDVLNKGLYKFYLRWAQMGKNEIHMINTWTKMVEDRVPYF